MSTSTRSHEEVTASRAAHVLRTPPTAAVVLDVFVICGAVVAAAMLRHRGVLFDSLANVPNLQIVGASMAAGWIALIGARGGYQHEVFGAGMDEYKRVVNGSALAAGGVGIACYLLNYPLSRGFYVAAFVIGVPALMVSRYVLRKLLQRARRKGHFRQRVLVVGTPQAVDEVTQVLRRETWLGYEIVGALTPTTDLAEETNSGVPVIANSDEAATVAVQQSIETVIFAGGGISSQGMRRMLWDLETANVHVVVAPSMTDIASDRVKIRPVGGLPLVHVGKPRAAEALSWAKRGFDVVGALVLLVVLSPLMALVALLIKRHDGGPVLFRQERVGRAAARFACLKFRTMTADAEERRGELLALHDHCDSHGMFKMKDDPRVTRPGRWLRRYSLDELPQLWNVLRGEMSLVGPRPPLPTEVAAYDVTASRRLRVRPGMTGLWQVSGRSDLSWSETVRLDVYYVDNWSMLQDVSILIKTVRAVVRSSGAY